MEVDEATPRKASAEVQSPEGKVIRVESEGTQDYVRETLAISQERRWASCQAPWVTHEGPFTSVTIDAVKRPSDTGRQPQWLLKKVKPPQSICACCAKTKNWCSLANAHCNHDKGKEWWRRRRIMECYGRCLGANNFCAECGSTSLLRGQV